MLDVRRSSFALATARQVSACRAEAFGVGVLGVGCQMNPIMSMSMQEPTGRFL